MKIKELEELLSVSRSNIRFYEKQGLFTPERKDNNYREYTEQDVEELKKIILLRKMGLTVEEIRSIGQGELHFDEALGKAKLRLEEEIEQLNGSLSLVRQISKQYSSFDEIDISETWKNVTNSEKSGERFIDVCKDILTLELTGFDIMLKYVFFHDFKKSRKKYGTPVACLILLLICISRGFARLFIWKESFWSGFLYPFALVLAGSAIILPIYLLGKKFPRVASVIITIILAICFLFLGAILLLLIYGLILYGIPRAINHILT